MAANLFSSVLALFWGQKLIYLALAIPFLRINIKLLWHYSFSSLCLKSILFFLNLSITVSLNPLVYFLVNIWEVSKHLIGLLIDDHFWYSSPVVSSIIYTCVTSVLIHKFWEVVNARKAYLYQRSHYSTIVCVLIECAIFVS